MILVVDGGIGYALGGSIAVLAMTANSEVQQKIARLRAGKKLRVLDLFSGCGGLSLGFHAAGFEIAAAVEFDPDAAKSHGINFHPQDARHHQSRDITEILPTKLVADLDLESVGSAFDVIIGGPPCQAFARVGRSKLREVADHPEAFRHDPRSRLYIKYLEYVDECKPLIVVMENVPDMLNHGGHNIAGEVCDVLSARGYECAYTLLNAAFFGVPQMRERMFLIALHEKLGVPVSFPSPTHWIDLPSGYEGSRSVALKLLASTDNPEERMYYKAAPEPSPSLPPAVTASEALRDLPAIYARNELASGTLKRGARRLNLPVPYGPAGDLSPFARNMRQWPAFSAGNALFDHVIRYLPRDYELFARLQPGDQYPQAYALAERMFEEALERESKLTGIRPHRGSRRWEELRAGTVPPYDAGKFPNKWRKMEADLPARTLMAHLGKDSYSHIHYDSDQARTISVREAARLQSFPDGFRFSGTMNPAFRQIGNAVPPLLSKAIADCIAEQIATSAIFPQKRVAGGRSK
jgi:DNA (cytosine-5)-methyltransferase 1